jgi:hypothetical protein
MKPDSLFYALRMVARMPPNSYQAGKSLHTHVKTVTLMSSGQKFKVKVPENWSTFPQRLGARVRFLACFLLFLAQCLVTPENHLAMFYCDVLSVSSMISHVRRFVKFFG